MNPTAYDHMGLADLRDLVEKRAVEVVGDARYRKNLVAALLTDDARRANAQEQERLEAAKAPSDPEKMSELEKKLAKKVPQQQVRFTGTNRVFNPVNEALTVRNLPGDYTFGWASLAVGGGQDVGHWASLGWIRAEASDCTMDPSDTSKIYVPSFEDYNGYVRHNDCLLMIANRRIMEQRKAAGLRRWQEKFEGLFGARGSSGETRGAITDEAGHTLRTTSQWRPEEGMKEGHG